MAKPIVAIVGRPNVGKSTLFNMLVGERLSIVKDTPGVRRDRIYADVNWLNYHFTLMDTGGIEPETNNQMLRHMREQAEMAIEMADVVMFVVDVKQGVVDADYKVAEMLRKAQKKIVLVVNKVDNFDKLMPDVYEFYNLGLGDPYPISSIGKLGIGRLEEEEPQLHVVWNESLGEIHVQLMGEVQLEVLRSLLAERFGLEVSFGPGGILYKETITEPMEGVGHYEPLRHYAEVHLLLEPLPRGSGMQFAADCREEVLDKNWQRLVLTHLEEKQHLGVLTGAPLTDLPEQVLLRGLRSHLCRESQSGGRRHRRGRQQLRAGFLPGARGAGAHVLGHPVRHRQVLRQNPCGEPDQRGHSAGDL